MKKRIAFAMTMGVITTGIISFTLLSLNTNYSGSQFLSIWTKSWAIAYLVVIPCILFIGPRVEQVVNRVIKD